MKTYKIWLALSLLTISLFLLKLAYITSNGHVAMAALIIGALFILSGLSLTMEEEKKDSGKFFVLPPADVFGPFEKSYDLSFKDKITAEEKMMKKTPFKARIDSEEARMSHSIPKVAKKRVNKK